MKKLQNIIALLYLSITYLSTTYFIWCMTRYTMRWERVPSKVTRSTKLQGAQRSPELRFRSTDFHAPENLIFPALCHSTSITHTSHWEVLPASVPLHLPIIQITRGKCRYYYNAGIENKTYMQCNRCGGFLCLVSGNNSKTVLLIAILRCKYT